MEAKNYKFGMFCQQCHPSVASGDADIRRRNASQIHTSHEKINAHRELMVTTVVTAPGPNDHG